MTVDCGMLETMTLTPVIWLNIALFPADGFPISAIPLGVLVFDVVSAIRVVSYPLRSFYAKSASCIREMVRVNLRSP